MQSKVTQRPGRPGRIDPSLKRMVILSLGLHLAAVLVLSGVILPRFQRPKKPVYMVDLVNLPVKDPQAGRPDVRPAKDEKKAAAPTPPEPQPAPPVPKAETKPVAPKPEPKPDKTVVTKKPEPPPAPAKKETHKAPPKAEPKPKESYEDTLAAMEKMREKVQRQQEIEELKRKLAAMAASDSRGAEAGNAPPGMPTGKGTEAGVDEQTWIQAYLKQNWSLSQYQVTRKDVRASARIAYDAGGVLLNYELTKASGDATFDDSVKRAILKGKQLPFQPGRRLEIDVEFNLKELIN